MTPRFAALVAAPTFMLMLGSMTQQAVSDGAKPLLAEAVDDSSLVVIPVSALDKSVAFYEGLGCKVVAKEGKGAVSLSGGGLRIRLLQAAEVHTTGFPVLMWRTRNPQESSEEMRRLGISGFRISDYPDTLKYIESFGKTMSCDVFKDPDGHILTLAHWKDQK